MMNKLSHIALPLLLAAFAHAAAASGTGSVAGVIWTQSHGGPDRPGKVNRRPLKGQVSASNTKSRAVTRVSSDGKGAFRLTLPSGHYVLHVEAAVMRARVRDVEIDVVAGRTCAPALSSIPLKA